ncbi:hypothetical protein AB0C18_06330 [Nonomuraea muscovyensis]|uniref:hypothetical protein n=1 Tax=Nonomuraea muscovyensis TaxID=1124761 RepID=UPI0033F53CFF
MPGSILFVVLGLQIPGVVRVVCDRLWPLPTPAAVVIGLWLARTTLVLPLALRARPRASCGHDRGRHDAQVGP